MLPYILKHWLSLVHVNYGLVENISTSGFLSYILRMIPDCIESKSKLILVEDQRKNVKNVVIKVPLNQGTFKKYSMIFWNWILKLLSTSIALKTPKISPSKI